MRQRGRRSLTETSTLIVDTSRQTPPAPPSELTDAQAQVWRDVVGSLPGNWLTRAAHPILIAYCRHACRSRLLEIQIAQFELEWTRTEGGLERLDKLLAASERETRAMMACARALRLTPQAQMHPRTAGRAISNLPQGPRPWET
jgi:phage terminase small subunit